MKLGYLESVELQSTIVRYVSSVISFLAIALLLGCCCCDAVSICCVSILLNLCVDRVGTLLVL